MFTLANINEHSHIPKYKQLANLLIQEIRQKKNNQEEKLPSINYLSLNYDISRDTVEKAYKELRKKNLIEAVPGKGYYVKQNKAAVKPSIFLLFNKLSAHKKVVYESFCETIGDAADIDFHVYNNDYKIFRQLLENNEKNYSKYVIISHFFDHFQCAKDIINLIPKDKLLLLDKKVDGIHGNFACVYQDFEKNIYEAMVKAHQLLKKYRTIKLLFPAVTYQPREIIRGFQKFCIEYNYLGKIVSQIEQEPVAKGEAYVTMMEDDLVTLVKKIKKANLRVGQEIGIISYNENSLKEILLDGITIISTDFRQLGISAAKMILENKTEQIENPFHLIIRNSL